MNEVKLQNCLKVEKSTKKRKDVCIVSFQPSLCKMYLLSLGGGVFGGNGVQVPVSTIKWFTLHIFKKQKEKTKSTVYKRKEKNTKKKENRLDWE